MVSKVRGPLTYHVCLSDGRVFRRHVHHVRACTCISFPSNGDIDIEIPSVNTSPDIVPPATLRDDVLPPPSRRSTQARAPPDYYRPQM